MDPPAALSSPVAETSTSPDPLAGDGVTVPLVVCGPVFGRFRMTDPTTPQLPAESNARTKTVCLPALRQSSRTGCGPVVGQLAGPVAGIIPVAPITLVEPKFAVIGTPKPTPVLTASSTTNSAW